MENILTGSMYSDVEISFCNFSHDTQCSILFDKSPIGEAPSPLLFPPKPLRLVDAPELVYSSLSPLLPLHQIKFRLLLLSLAFITS